MRLDNDSDELSLGRLFIYGQLNDPMTGGPLHCRRAILRDTRVDRQLRRASLIYR
jgi:hypothetical protein